MPTEGAGSLDARLHRAPPRHRAGPLGMIVGQASHESGHAPADRTVLFHCFQHIRTVVEEGIDNLVTGLIAGQPSEIPPRAVTFVFKALPLHDPVHGDPEHAPGHQRSTADGIRFFQHQDFQTLTGSDQCGREPGAGAHDDHIHFVVETRTAIVPGYSIDNHAGAGEHGTASRNKIASLHEVFPTARSVPFPGLDSGYSGESPQDPDR